MERLLKVVVVVALMMVLMATTVSPAFANGNGWGPGTTGYHNGVSQDPGHEKGESQGWCAEGGEYNTAYYCPHKHD